MILGPFKAREYWQLRQALDSVFPHTVNLQKGPYLQAEHDTASAWCRSRMVGGNGLYFVKQENPDDHGLVGGRDAMIDATEHWCSYMRLWSFKDPNIAFEFKLRFG
ncbi:MAG: hypothetical protein EOP83_12300 [Verrucomicrobiaceae bacterium]|nr:MAG: hypothetical protein EOP83_12300 [Verrucomicrobiaceae bacterium]